MSTTAKDPLLMAAKVMTIIARVVLMIGMIVLGIGLAGATMAALGWLPDNWIEHVRVESGGTFDPRDLWPVVPAMLAALVVFGLSFEFVTKLAQMIDTVGKNEVFTLANAARLTRMAWLLLGIELASLLASALSTWAEQRFDDTELEFTSEFSLSGIALAIVLFILARVFREGARMRDELEGTV